MKKLSILAFVLLCAAVVSAQHQRRVLIEEFTNASCPPCAAYNPAFNATIAANIQYLTPIKYQTNWPGVDPMNAQTQSDVSPRVDYYSVNGVPYGNQNGTLEISPVSSYSQAQIQTAYNTLTPVTINLSHSFNAAVDSVLVSVSVTSDAAITGNFRLHVGIVEDEILFAKAPGTNGEAEFFQVMRKMLPNGNGTTTGNFTAGQTKTYSFAWKITNIYNLQTLSVAAFLQNNANKEVLQSERSEPVPVEHHGAKIASNTVFACAEGYIPVLTMTNTGSAELTTVNMTYRQGTGPWSNFTWTGSLAPGATTGVPLTDIVINTAGTVKLEVIVLNSNLGYQTNFVNPLSTINIKAVFDPGQATPFVQEFQSAAFPPPSWSVTNAGTNGWKLATNAGGAGSTRSARCNMFDMEKGQVASMVTPKLDLSATTGGTTLLTFDHAYATRNFFSFDSLRILISSNCGETWETIFHDGKNGLATAPSHATSWLPEDTEWRANQIDISAYNGSPEVLVNFMAESGFGNHLFIDNLNVTSTVGTKELLLSNFNLVPNPTRDYAEVRFGLETAQNIQLYVYSSEGALVQSQLLGDLATGEHRIVMNANTLASGSYRVVLQGSQGLAQTQWVVVK